MMSFYDILVDLKSFTADAPLSFEDVDLAVGYMMYRTNITGTSTDNITLGIEKFHDRAIVLVDMVCVFLLKDLYATLWFYTLPKTSMMPRESLSYRSYNPIVLESYSPVEAVYLCLQSNCTCVNNSTMPYSLFQVFQGILDRNKNKNVSISPGKVLDIFVSQYSLLMNK